MLLKIAVTARPGIAEVEWLGQRERVRALTMSDLVKAAGGRVDLVKMDIEGAELDVLTENNEWLKAVNAFVMELHPRVYGAEGLKQIVNGLAKTGFSVMPVRMQIGSERALPDCMRAITLSLAWPISVLWRALVSLVARSYTHEYWLAVKARAS